MTSLQLTVAVFFWGSAVVIGIDAIKATGWQRIVLWGLTGAFICAGFLVKPLWDVFPDVSTALVNLVRSPLAWFVLGVVAYLGLRRSVPLAKQSLDNRDPESLPDFGHLAVLEHRIEHLEQTAVTYDDSQMKNELHAIRQKQAAIIDDYQRMLALEGRFNEAINRIDYELGSQAAHRSLDNDRTAQQITALYSALSAIWHRERLHHFGQQIEIAAMELSTPTDMGAHLNQDQWEEWEGKERAWRGALKEWCDLAAQYVPTIHEQVFTVPDEHYTRTGSAKLKQFPDAEAYTAYKAFWAVLKNWRDDRQGVYDAVHAVAFDGHIAENTAQLPTFGRGQ